MAIALTNQYAERYDGIGLPEIRGPDDFKNLTLQQKIKLGVWILHELDSADKQDIHERVDWILDSKHPLTSSLLTEGERNGQIFANDAVNAFPIMRVIKQDADIRLSANKSLKGWGIEKAIVSLSLEEALKKLGLTGQIGERDVRGFWGKHVTQRGQSPDEKQRREEQIEE